MDSGRWTLDVGPRTLDSGVWTLDAGRWTLDVECQAVDVKTLKFKTDQNFENNGAILVTLFFHITLSNHLKI